MKLRILFFLISLTSVVGCKWENESENEVRDIDGNIYHFVTLGTQVWMVENLKTTRYQDGTVIPKVTDSNQWINLSTGAYCDYNNSQLNSIEYGRLYNWYAVTDTHNVCPIGWHVPYYSEWETLETYLGGNEIAGGKLKESGTFHWVDPNNADINSSGFKALPGGYRDNNGNFFNMKEIGNWWCSYKSGSTDSWGWYLYNYEIKLYSSPDEKIKGNSVRCVKFNTD